MDQSIRTLATSVIQGKRLLGLDFGLARIGIATCDKYWMIATPHSVLSRQNMRKDLGHLARLVREEEIGGIIMGLPIAMDGSEGENCQMVRHFAQKLADKILLPIAFQDERMSTAFVTETMRREGVKRQQRHLVDDKLAAAAILQLALDQVPNRN